MNLNDFINKYFGVILLASAASGLLIPTGGLPVEWVIIIALAFIIFISFFQVDLNKSMLTGQLPRVSLFILLRYLALPVMVYFAILYFSPFYAAAFFLITALPSAVSSPAFTAMFRGNISLALKLLVFTSFLAIASIPLLFEWTLSKNIEVDGGSIALTMVYVIVIPFFLHLFFRGRRKIRGALAANSPVLTAAGLAVIFIVSTSHNKAAILNAPAQMIVYAAISIAGYFALYFIGFYFFSKQSFGDRIAWSISSGANNIGLGVTLSALYFSGEMNIFFIISQMMWIFMLIPLKRLLSPAKN